MGARTQAAKQLIGGNGCTCAPELWMHDICDEHDADYATHADENGAPLTRNEADTRFLKAATHAAPWPRLLTVPIAFFYWAAVRTFGARYWNSTEKQK